MQIKQIPELVFEHQNMFLPYLSGDLTTKDYSDIFLGTFFYVKKRLPQYAASIQGLFSESEASSSSNLEDDDTQLSEYQRARIGGWLRGGSAMKLLECPVSKLLPKTCPDRCGIPGCFGAPPRPEPTEMSSEGISWKADVRKNHKDETSWVRMHLIMLGFAYAMASHFLRVGHSKADECTEVVLTPIDYYARYGSGDKMCQLMIPDPRLLSWVQTMAKIFSLS